MAISKKDRALLFDKYGGRCAYCGDELVKGWHVDHIEPIVRDWVKGGCDKPENERFDNYNPSCASCNILKSSSDLEELRRRITQFIQSLNKYSTQYKFAKRYGLVSETDIKVVFYFERLEEQARKIKLLNINTDDK